MSIRNIFKRRGFYSVALSVMLSVIFVATAVSAATTIDSNINTGGTLSVTGATTLSSTVTISGALTANAAATLNENGTAVDFRVESDTQANMLYVDGTNDRVGIASSTPQAVLSVENTGSDDSFVVNDAAADSTPFVIDASGNVGVASSSPAQEVGVNGDVHLGSAATSTLTVESSNANEGGCIELEGTNDTYFRIYATASTSNTGQLIVEAGKCQ